LCDLAELKCVHYGILGRVEIPHKTCNGLLESLTDRLLLLIHPLDGLAIAQKEKNKAL
jgi:hypothetical protein